MSVTPRQQVPEIDLEIVGGGRFVLSQQTPRNFIMVVVYRGIHCPICKSYLSDLNRRAEEFDNLGVRVIAVTSDNAERAVKAKNDWKLDKLDVAYNMPIALGREWGLYVSKGLSDQEPAEFIEPGLFLVKPDGSLYAASIQTMPFARPSFAEIAGAIKFVTEMNYPARGEA
jgi:peroxiredoxin